MVAVSELVSGLDAELVRLGYKASTMVWYRGCWRRLEKFFESSGVEEFSLDVAMTWYPFRWLSAPDRPETRPSMSRAGAWCEEINLRLFGLGQKIFLAQCADQRVCPG